MSLLQGVTISFPHYPHSIPVVKRQTPALSSPLERWICQFVLGVT